MRQIGKKLLCWLLCVALISVMVVGEDGCSKPILVKATETNPDFAGGEGTEKDPYQITTPKQLAAMQNYLGEEYLNLHFILMNDIDLDEYLSSKGDGYHDGKGWNPIGKNATNQQFLGNFNGNGCKITGLWMERSGESYVGLFGCVGKSSSSNGHIKNLSVEAKDIRGSSYTGILVGYLYGELENCQTIGLVEGTNYVGGLAGCQLEESYINNCYSNCKVVGSGDSIGGLVGRTTDTPVIKDSHSNSEVLGNAYIGGLVGDQGTLARIETSYASGRVDGVNCVGGLVGDFFGSGGEIVKSFSNCKVSGNDNIGGLCGRSRLSGNIVNCYATGDVSGSNYVGGLIGEQSSSGSIVSSYAIGAVSGTSNVGGLVGYLSSSGSNDYNYFNTETTGQPYGVGDGSSDSGITGKTTANMKKKGTFQNWDFTNVWCMKEDNTFPRLIWEVYPIGTGSEDDPYRIGGTPEQLADLNYFLGEEMVDQYFLLTNDIDLKDYLSQGHAGYHEGRGWEPIGKDTSGRQFFGNLDGDGHHVTGLWMDRGGEQDVGLFGCIGKYGNTNGYVKNIRIEIENEEEKSGIKGFNYVGAVVGSLHGSIENVYAHGQIEGNSDVGGLVGYQGLTGNVVKGHAECGVTGVNNVGGLIGRQYGKVADCYAGGEINGNGYVGGLIGYQYEGGISNSYVNGKIRAMEQVGGLIGYQNNGNLSNCFYDIETTQLSQGIGNKSQVDGVTGKGTSDLMREAVYKDWDFVDIWYVEEGMEYPCLIWELFMGGRGSEDDPYRIGTLNQLVTLGGLLGERHREKYYVMMTDLDFTEYLSEGSEGFNEGKGWKPIGRYEKDSVESSFFGKLDGNGHEINGLWMDREDEDGVGLFGCIALDGKISNLRMESVEVVGCQYVGTFVGYSLGSVSNCYANGLINGEAYIGGVVGCLKEGMVDNCHVDMEVYGESYIGGLVGRLESGSIGNCTFRGKTTHRYLVQYNANGGNGVPLNQIKIQGEELALSDIEPIREGYTFIGWNTDKDAETAEYNPNELFLRDKNTTLYAVWKKVIYTLSYHVNEGVGDIPKQDFEYGSLSTINEAKPTREGYAFLGWNTKKNAVNAIYMAGSDYMFQEDTVLYAIWKKIDDITISDPTSTQNPIPTQNPAPSIPTTPAPNPTIKTITALPKPVLLVKENSPSSIKITWSKIAGAKQYEIYRMGGKDKSFKLLGSVAENKTSYMDKKADKGYTYSYKLIAYGNGEDGKEINSESSTVKVALTGKPVTPQIKLSLKGRVLTITWKGTTGATDIEVYSKKEKGKFKNLRTGKIKSFKNNVRIRVNEKNKTFYFRIRTYSVIRGKKVYSAYSKTKKIKS